MNIKIGAGSTESSSQNVHFADQNPSYTYDVGSEMDPTRSSSDMNDADIANFFSRPLKIATYEWSTSTANFFESFNPWNLYLQNKRVINRICNFNLLRCKLKVKFIINGNGFHYGRIMASYLPLDNNDDFTRARAFIKQDLIAASQRPKILLDPTTSQGGELTLPFLWYKNDLSIPNQDWQDMGIFHLMEIARLKHANGANDRVTISVFAWAEDVCLSIPTSTEPGALVAQSGQDEYGSGPISGPASVLARVAGMLTEAPVIGPFALATQIAASATGKIAKMFGYSRPAVISDIQSYKPTVMGNLANTNMPDTCQRLTLDTKQELTVDSRVMGLAGTDEMTIHSVACRESYLTQFPWDVSDSVETALFNVKVSPVVWDTYLNGMDNEIHMPACCFATIPFQSWRGTMKYRFQIIASNFHKGRLKIVYDPWGFQSNEYNTNYTYIVDIAEHKDFSVEVGWGQQVSYRDHDTPGLNSVPFANTAPFTVAGTTTNGALAVYVVNELTVPNSTVSNDITVAVYVSACDDLEVANPSSQQLIKYSYFTPQSSWESQSEVVQTDADSTDEPSKPIQTETAVTLGPNLTLTDQMKMVHYGEEITSFRQCLKRYNLHTVYGVNATGPNWSQLNVCDFPAYYGLAPGALWGRPGGLAPVNYCKVTLLNWLTPAYTARRGSIRWKYHTYGSTKGGTDKLCVTRFPRTDNQTASWNNFTEFGVDDKTRMAHEGLGRTINSWGGAVVSSTSANPAVEAELPFYSAFRFAFAKSANMGDPPLVNSHFHRCEMTNSPDTSGFAPRLESHVSVGEDFNLAMYTGPPVMYYLSSSPPVS